MQHMSWLRIQSIATLGRLSFRLLILAVFATLWPGQQVALATAVLCLTLATACAVSATVFGEPVLGSALNRWDEAAVLFCVALFAYLLSGLNQRWRSLGSGKVPGGSVLPDADRVDLLRNDFDESKTILLAQAWKLALSKAKSLGWLDDPKQKRKPRVAGRSRAERSQDAKP
jgi:hypothetical protein